MSIVEREKQSCFYCLKAISESDYALDHVHPQVSGGSNLYRNIVASCFECNSRKQSRDAEDFLRSNYRSGILTQEEYLKRLEALKALDSGLLVPKI